jgi:hypothetical protein
LTLIGGPAITGREAKASDTSSVAAEPNGSSARENIPAETVAPGANENPLAESGSPGVHEHRRVDLAANYKASYRLAITHFLDRLDDGTPFETAPDDNLRTLAIVEAAYTGGAITGGRG